MTILQRFWSKVDIHPETGCWVWTASFRKRSDRPPSAGYPQFAVSPGRSQLAHRLAYHLFVGPIPDGLTLDHLCRNACVNPDHLEPVTNRENILRGESFSAVNARKTHCKRGHPLSGANVRHYAGRRFCKTCMQERNQRRYTDAEASA